jgi:hypothetical protein
MRGRGAQRVTVRHARTARPTPCCRGAGDVLDDDGLSERARIRSAKARERIGRSPAGNGTIIVIGREG